MRRGFVLLALVPLACADTLVEDVSTDVCASGKRWLGDATPSDEMLPGHDCVGCHQNQGGPELVAGGTIYGVIDKDGSRTLENDCFGVEGALVTITANDGQVLQALTNRAGNFYFEGRQGSLATPFSVMVEYAFADGRYSRQRMNSSPSYGGCGRCHSIDLAGTLGAAPGQELASDEVVPYVLPIFTGPVHE
jgi:hypothetical protein